MGDVGLLKQVDFGRLDAESDDRLLDYFLKTGSALEILTGKYLVIGRKGSGKTALFRFASSEMRDEGDVIELDLDAYVFLAHRSLEESGVPTTAAYTASWRFAITILMYLRVRDSLPINHRNRGDGSIRAIVNGPNVGVMSKILGWLKRVRKVDLPSVTGVADLGSMEVADQESHFIDSTTLVELDKLENILRERFASRPIHALIDRLDDAWDGSPESLNIIIGAVRATRYYSHLFNSEGAAPVVAFLRTDLWDGIRFNDKNKFSQDSVFLDWTDEELTAIIEARIDSSIAGGGTGGRPWNWIFTSDEMRQRTSSKRYIQKRCLGRPRDIIAFAIHARDVAIRNGREVIENDDIYGGERMYSRHIVDELIDELQNHVPNIDGAIGALKGLGKRTFSLAEWEAEAGRRGLSADDAALTLESLFEASVVGVYSSGGQGGGSKTVYRYKDRFVQARESGQLQVHPGFTKELNLKDA